MSITSTEQAKGVVQVMQRILATNTQFTSTNNLAGNFVRAAQPKSGYGLPCSKCGTYYMADAPSAGLTTWPTCQYVRSANAENAFRRPRSLLRQDCRMLNPMQVNWN